MLWNHRRLKHYYTGGESLEDWKIKIAALWIVWECTAIVTITLQVWIPGFVEEWLAKGRTTPEGLLVTAIVLLIVPVMAFLSLTLKDSINRWANIILGIVFAVPGLASAIMYLSEPSAYNAGLILVGIVEVVVAALIVWYAWKSKQKA